MDRQSTKRPRESSAEQSPLPEIGNGKKQRLHGGSDDAKEPLPRTFFDFDLSFGVFDFPWLKESLIYSESEDWKLDDVFFTSFYNGLSTADATTIGTELSSGQLVWSNLPDPWEAEYEAQVPPTTLDDGGGGQAGEGMDCIWKSLLNQPLQQGSRAL